MNNLIVYTGVAYLCTLSQSIINIFYILKSGLLEGWSPMYFRVSSMVERMGDKVTF